MPNTVQLKKNGQPVFPVTDVSLVMGLAERPLMDAVYAWDGTGTPDITKIPAGVTVEYNTTTYTGTLAASADTTARFYLVPSTTVPGEYDRYLTDAVSGSYSWKSAGTTAIPTPSIVDNLESTDPTKALSAKQGKVLNEELGELEAKVTDLELPSGSYTQAQARVYNHPEEWCFLLNQPGTGIRKPIWHIGNGVFIDAAGAVISFEVITPATPTFSPDGGSVAEGTVVTLACATLDADIYVSTDDGETYTKTSTVTISEAVTLMAYSELEGIRSAVVSKVFTIAVDHRFKFTVKLDQDNATVYVPVANGNYYTMEVDWGDGSTPDSYNNALIGMKNCKHTYSGLAGDTFQITIRGTSIPYLLFSNRSVTAHTPAQLYSIDDNSLDITTRFALNSSWAKIDFKGCANLVSVCKNLVSSVPAEERINIIFESCAALTTIPTEVFSAMTTIEYFYFNGCTALSMSAETMSVFATKIGNITNLLSAFGGCKGSIPIPDDFFDNLTDGTVTDVRQMTGSAATGVTGDAKKLYDVLAVKATSGIANTAGCFSGTNLSNRNQVPTAWGGTM